MIVSRWTADRHSRRCEIISQGCKIKRKSNEEVTKNMTEDAPDTERISLYTDD